MTLAAFRPPRLSFRQQRRETRVRVACLDLAFESLAAALVSFLHVFDPELLILGGNISAAGMQLLAPLHEEVEHRTNVLLGRKVPIVLQSAVGYGGVAGAAGLVFLQQRLLTI